MLSRISLVSVALAVALAGQATALPNVSTNVQCSADGNSAFAAVDCNVGGFVGVPSNSTGHVDLSTTPTVAAEATSPANGVFGAGTSATALYYFQVTGGSPGDLVPIVIQTRLTLNATAEANA